MTRTQRVLTWVGRLLLPAARSEFVLGDVLELHALRRERSGWLRATLLGLRDLLASGWSAMRPGDGGRRGEPRGGRTSLVAETLRDLAHSIRAVTRDPGFSAVTVLTLALGVGAAASVFGMVNQFVLRPLPGTTAPDGAAYLRLLERASPNAWNGMGLATLDFDAFREAADFTEGVAAYGNSILQVAVAGERPRAVSANTVYGDFFEVLGVRAAEGRMLSAEDNAFGADPLVAVLSSELKNELFGPDRPGAGATVLVNGVAVAVIGVAWAGFQGAERDAGARMWIPYPALEPLVSFTEERLLSRRSTMHDNLLVRLRPGWTPDRAEERVQALIDGIGQTVPEQAEYLARMEPSLYPGLATRPGARAPIARTLSTLAGVVGMVLLLACGNVANLFLFRNVRRRSAAAVRRALGASPGRIVRAELAHSLTLAALGSVAGLGVAWVISVGLRGETLIGMPEMGTLVLDGRVLAFGIAMSFTTAILFGCVPAVLAGRFDLRGALQAAGGRDTGRVAKLRSGMASFQIALSLALLVAGVMLVRTVVNLYALDTGLHADDVAVQFVEFPSDFEEEDRRAARRRLVQDLEALPGVERAAVGLYDPLGSARLMGRLAGTVGESDPIRAEMVPVSAEWFDALDVTSASGAPIRVSEDEWVQGAVVLTHGMAARLFEDATAAVGRTIGIGFGRTLQEARVLAVTTDLRRPNEPDAAREAFLVPFEGSPLPSTTLIVRMAALDRRSLAEVRTTVEAALPDAPVAEPVPLHTRLDAIHAEERVFSRLLGLLSVFALALASVGLYGVVAFSVASRRREFGVRIAVGAGAARIARLVIGYAGTIVLVGSTVGVLGGYALSLVLESRLYGVEAADPLSYVVAVTLFGLTAAVACWLPTRRAMTVDPVTALRTE